MVHIVDLTGATVNVTYDHNASSMNERERDYIFSGAGNDVIYGDSEETLNYNFGGLDLWEHFFKDFFAAVVPFGWVEFTYEFGTGYSEYERPTLEQAIRYQDVDWIVGSRIRFSNGEHFEFDEFIDAGAGNDLVDGRGGNDWIVGGAGTDTLIGGIGNDFLEGDEGNDLLAAGSGEDTVLGGTGNDTIEIIGFGNDYANGGDDFDTAILTNAGSQPFTFDLLTGTGHSSSWQNNELFYAVNFESLSYNGGSVTDTIGGGNSGDILNGFGGSDFLDGRGGDDVIDGGAERDFLTGGDGSDRIYGGSGNDFIDDGAGDDIVFGGSGNDDIFTGMGNDTVYGGAGDDIIKENSPDDPKTPTPKGYNDIIYGEAGRDVIEAGTGDDVIYGGADQDTIRGGSGNDQIDGGQAEDIINGGSGHDRMSGGSGKDVFLFEAADIVELHGGALSSRDQIRDFNVFEDTLDLREVAIYATGGKLFLDDNDGTPGEAGEIAFVDHGTSTELVIDFEGDGIVDFSIDFLGVAYDPGGNSLGPNVLLA